jgi:pyruvate ferredoxin oxidoreductase beta subunit
VMTPCPTGWRFPPEKAIEVSRLAVETWILPLYEIERGVLKLSLKPKPKPVKEYIRIQRRFRTLSDDALDQIQAETDLRRERLLEKDGHRVCI